MDLISSKTWFSVNELAAEFEVNRRTIIRLIEEDDMPAYKLGGQWRIKRDELEDYLQARHTGRQSRKSDALTDRRRHVA